MWGSLGCHILLFLVWYAHISAFCSSALGISLSAIFWSHLQANWTVSFQDLWEFFFPEISVLSVVVYAVLFLIVNCNRRWHKFDVIGENWWARSSLCQIKPSKGVLFGPIPLLGQIIVWVLQGHAVVSLQVLISCSGSEHQQTCIWVCKPLPVANPPLRCPSVLWEGSAGALAGSGKKQIIWVSFIELSQCAGSDFPPKNTVSWLLYIPWN